MKRNILLLLVVAVLVVGCKSDNAPVNDGEFVEYADCVGCGDVNVVRYSMPNGNDLKLETAHHVIQIDAQPGKQYDYYVWTGDKDYADNPDIIVQEGTAAVLVEE